MENILKSNIINRCKHNADVMNKIREVSKNMNISNNEFLVMRDNLLKSLIPIDNATEYMFEKDK